MRKVKKTQGLCYREKFDADEQQNHSKSLGKLQSCINSKNREYYQ